MKAILLACVLLASCAAVPTPPPVLPNIPGVEISDAERDACKREPCTVWTEKELGLLARKFYEAGYKAGVKSL